ncbi:stage III sporulation protein AF [Metabacillus arenae]|uniref:Stage III sporulation protein AF n=1 Tax=Metabacillus arenae TaxID=2771434 RepID=A0A926RVS7_9BACI|nr:stage III sporulation protein AF [Metabacillus arenae]MBD1378800.1 stage III sporulation protein AF [Metabacillus arenae]
MGFLTEWITSIILFILLAIIIELLLPNSSMQKYAKMVISLLLIVVILTPIFQIFSMDFNEIASKIKFESAQNNEIKNSIELQKKEIQASQRAYILEEMAVQMENAANKELADSYDATIDKVILTSKEKQPDITSQEELELAAIEVHISEKQDSAAVEAIQPIEINPSKENESVHHRQEKKKAQITSHLANIWELEQEQITVFMKGGEER